ncbi:MAG: hypothetical protein COX48_04780 [bacterium (Candidatus Stahlbacteria) CG23_combo_of_CG06-09_8_20_14_all_34_7]|nr:MAG: hypothetical protein COX48_04780 [bacterium (Candidatus Stahlbacteria) CG23_combo_of_CG06-09_8_20_14_all_34_7]
MRINSDRRKNGGKMKFIIFLIFIILSAMIVNGSFLDLYTNENISVLIANLDSLEKSKGDISCSLLYYSAELMNNVQRSVALYTQIVNFHTDSPFFNMSQLRLAKYYTLLQDSAKASLYLKRIIASKDSFISQITYVSMIALYERYGDLSNTSKYIKEFQTDYPSSQFLSYYTTDKTSHSIIKETFYSIQIGSFKSSENANNLIEKFKKKKYDVYKVNENDLIKVRIGKFKTKDDAKSFLKVFQKAETIPAWIVKLE